MRNNQISAIAKEEEGNQVTENDQICEEKKEYFKEGDGYMLVGCK